MTDRPVTEDPKALAEYLVAKAMEAFARNIATEDYLPRIRERMSQAAQTITNELDAVRAERDSAADAYRERIEAPLRAEVERLTAERDDATARTIHSCHAGCSRPMCVLRRERDTLRAEVERLTAERDTREAERDEARVIAEQEREIAHETLRKGMAAAQERHNRMRAVEAERDTLAAALVEVKEAAEWVCDTLLSGDTGCIDGAIRNAAECRRLLAALPADLAVEHGRRVEARALRAAADDCEDSALGAERNAMQSADAGDDPSFWRGVANARRWMAARLRARADEIERGAR